MTINFIQLKTLMLSVITEIKFGQPLAQNANAFKRQFKATMGMKAKATNIEVLEKIGFVYALNHKQEDYFNTLKKFKVDHLISGSYTTVASK